jgi:hypothetical protein
VLRRRPFLPPLLTLRRIAADLGPELAEVDELVGLRGQEQRGSGKAATRSFAL